MPEQLAWRDGPQGMRVLSNAEKNWPMIGQPLLNGAICIDVGKSDGGYTFVLAVRTDMAGDERVIDKWVTWECNPQGETFLGHYHSDLSAAVADFNRRVRGRDS